MKQSHQRAFLTMAAFSAITLLLGIARELFIARELRASGEADLFFRGLVVVAAVRSFSGVLFRARWLPVDRRVGAAALAWQEWKTIAGVASIGLAALWWLFSPAERADPAAWVCAIAVVFGVAGGVARALAERERLDRIAFGSEWALPLCTIGGAVLMGGGALGPALGLAVGLMIASLLPLPFLARGGSSSAAASPTMGMGALLGDTVLYVNLGLLDAALSTWVYAPGDYARLNYGYLFVNAVLAVPSAAATVIALRVASAREATRSLRRWSAIAGVAAAAGVGLFAAAFRIDAVAALIRRAIGWDLAGVAAPMLLASMPFAGLRLANTIGRQRIVASTPRALLVWDAVGLLGRAALLVALAPWLGIVASPLALGLAEAVQLIAWVPRGRTVRATSSR